GVVAIDLGLFGDAVRVPAVDQVALDQVVARSAVEHVMIVTTNQRVGAKTAQYEIVAFAGKHAIRAVASVDEVAAAGGNIGIKRDALFGGGDDVAAVKRGIAGGRRAIVCIYIPIASTRHHRGAPVEDV